MATTTDTKTRIGGLLVSKGIISRDQLDKALAIQEQEPETARRRLGTILYQDLGLDRHKIMQEISQLYAFSEIGVQDDAISASRIEFIQNLLEEIPNDLTDQMVHYKMIPYEENRDHLVIAAGDPTDPNIASLASQLPFKHYEIAYCRLEILEQIIERVYHQKNEFLDLLDEYTETEIPETTEEEIDKEELDAEINQSMLNSLVEGMLIEAVRQGASDIHAIPDAGNRTNLHFRIDGKLQLWHTQEGVKPEAIAAVVKDKSRNVDRFERESSQDGFIQRIIDNHQIRYRVSIMPLVGQEFDRKFESIVIRVLDDRKVITDLNKLGLQQQAFDDFLKAITKPSGIVIITGPTGSGKSTTLVAALYYVIKPTLNVLTVEEPVEYLIKGARQLKIGDHMSFDQSMRGILRHDPDIVLVGEIRDLKTAEIAIKLANTGHLTFSTLHTNDAPSAISRLYKMGVEPFLIANAVNLVMAQRLVRKLCEHCKEEYTDLHPELPRSLGFTDDEIENTTFYKAVGCNKCHQGYKGRAAIMEALYFTPEIRHVILESGTNIDEEKVREIATNKNGMLTLRASGRERIKNGITTLEEVSAITIED
ncbi:MAG TPA: ATPase, T2SS/T4P/T4SS family [bacterium]|nr:ATPase, T2SS/T4P/T4SS family [bacterium]